MKRSALPLPRYVLRKPIKSGGWAYYFNVPIWARKAGCPVRNEPLGIDYGAGSAARGDRAAAVVRFLAQRRQTDALSGGSRRPARSTGYSPNIAPTAVSPKLDPKTKRNHEVGFSLVGGYVLKDGRRLGQATARPPSRRRSPMRSMRGYDRR